MLQSFAPKNYKFKPPKEFKINICTPSKIDTHQLPSFTFKTLLSKPKKKTTENRDINFENINTRPRNKKLLNDLSINSDRAQVGRGKIKILLIFYIILKILK
jgi:hypothetical protein